MGGTILIYTDLDGTLLDDDYSFRGAEGALAVIRRRGIPLIPCSSKTQAEVERIRRRLGLEDPFIVENGAACFVPEGWRGIALDEGSREGPYRVIRLGADYARLRRFLAERGRACGVRGFGDAGASEVARRSGLPLEEAALARRRAFSEPFWFEGQERLAELSAAAEREGLEITRGGRFHHLGGRGADKGAAARRLTALLGRLLPGPLLTIGLGDGANDLPLLAAVDRAVLLPRADGAFEPCAIPGLLRARPRGSRGWNEAVLALLAELDSGVGRSC
ncbi:MAG: HAD-IIB family hydrolase [Desulfobacterales bacterium]